MVSAYDKSDLSSNTRLDLKDMADATINTFFNWLHLVTHILIKDLDENKQKTVLVKYITLFLSVLILSMLLFCKPSEEEKAKYNQMLIENKARWDKTHEKKLDIKDLLYD